MSASDVIKEVRKRAGITRKRLAQLLGLSSVQIIWMYEKGVRTPSTKTWMVIIEIAEEVGLKVTTDMMKD